MFTARSALRSTRPFIRSYATQEPVNLQRGTSKTPFYIAGTVVVLAIGYKVGTQGTPATPAVKGMQAATNPKTPGAREAAGLTENPHDRPSAAGGDQKAKSGHTPMKVGTAESK